MFKAWVCIIIMASGFDANGGSFAPTTSLIGDIARKEDCIRIGEAAIKASKRIQSLDNSTYQCVEMIHTPE